MYDRTQVHLSDIELKSPYDRPDINVLVLVVLVQEGKATSWDWYPERIARFGNCSVPVEQRVRMHVVCNPELCINLSQIVHLTHTEEFVGFAECLSEGLEMAICAIATRRSRCVTSSWDSETDDIIFCGSENMQLCKRTTKGFPAPAACATCQLTWGIHSLTDLSPSRTSRHGWHYFLCLSIVLIDRILLIQVLINIERNH